jgi:RNA polymerase sigma-70 factor (ECF subfamily)
MARRSDRVSPRPAPGVTGLPARRGSGSRFVIFRAVRSGTARLVSGGVEVTDEELLAQLIRGDEQAFTALVERYHPRLVRLAGSFVGHRELAEDIAQETWIAVLRGIDRFEGRSAFRSWLFQVCVNRARSVAVKERRTVPVDPGASSLDGEFRADGSWRTPPVAWSGAIDDDEAGLLDRVRRAIDDLPGAQRQVVVLRDVEGLPAAEVCQVLAISPANQRVLLHRGRSRVRRALSEAVSSP